MALASGVLPAGAQGITIDGRTATTITSQPGGHVTIGIAPADGGGVSVNGFARFDVAPPGASFGNEGVGALTIVSEVSGPGRSRIEGPLTVQGDRADLVLVNPDGIEVNGGRFENMRSVALIAGRREGGGGALTWRLTSDVTVGPQGLSADLRRLDILARRIAVDGPIRDPRDPSDMTLVLVAGPGLVTLDPTVFSPDDPAYLTLHDRGGAQDGVALTVSSGAILSGGRVTLRADGRGAGVRMDGQALASAGGFVLDAAGQVRLAGARVDARGDVALRGTAVAADGGRIASRGGAVAVEATADALSLSAMEVAAAGELTFGAALGMDLARVAAEGEGQGQLRAGAGLSLTGTTLVVEADLSLAAPSLAAMSDSAVRTRIESLSGNLRLTHPGAAVLVGALVQGREVAADLGSLSLDTTAEDRIAALVATVGDMGLRLSGGLANRSGRVLAAGDLRIEAGGDVLNGVALGAAAGARGMALASAPLLAGREVGQIGAAGRLDILAAGRFDNLGGFVSGSGVAVTADAISSAALVLGDLVLRRRCWLFFCRGTATGRLALEGGEIGSDRVLALTARQGIAVTGGQLRGDAGLRLDAPEVGLRARVYQDGYGLRWNPFGAALRVFRTWEALRLSAPPGGVTFGASTAVTMEGVDVAPGALADPAPVVAPPPPPQAPPPFGILAPLLR